MRATLSEEQNALVEAARDLASGGRKAARAVLDGGPRPNEPTSSLMGGFAGLAVPEDQGGAGGGLVDLCLLVRELAREVVPTPFVTHAAAVQVALAAGLDVTAPASGAEVWALAADEERDGWGPWDAALAGTSLTGVKREVPDGADATAVLVTTGEDGTALVVPSDRTPRESFDLTRPVADLRFDGVDVRASGVGAGAALTRAAVVVAADLSGAAQGAVDLAIEFAKTREQFGQPIGRFQAVAHRIAEVYAQVEAAWSLTLYAAWAASAGAADAASATHAAKAKAGDTAIAAAEACTQVHGGIGITRDADPHLYVRRAISGARWLGSPRWHRQQVGRALVGGQG